MIKEIVLKGNIDETQRARIIFKDFISKLQMDDMIIYELELVIGEVVANIIEHGGVKESEEILFEIQIGKSIIFEFKYNGNMPDEETIEEKIKLQNVDSIDELSFDGRGLFLIDNIMDKVKYSKDNDLVKIFMEKVINF